MLRRSLLALGAGVMLGVAGCAWILDRAFPPDFSRLAAGVEVLDRSGRTLSILPAPSGFWRLRTGVADVPPHLLDLLIAAEDRRFRQHLGVDPLALARATGQWIRMGRIVSGGSTLTMQAARLLEPRPRTLRSKAIEMLRALQLEARFSKDEILGIWLTLAPQGGNLEGIRAGALAWFGRPARQLDAAEAALLISLARRPEALRPDRHPAEARSARATLLHLRAASAAGMTAEDLALAVEAPVPHARLGMPRLARHVARDMARAVAPGGTTVTTTLDLSLQRATERLVATALSDLPERATAALVVAELPGREVRALVGGISGEEARAGDLDLTRAVRSPGSALKPLLYALAFEDGIARPETLLSDLPLRFGNYAPENFDRGFAGRVTAAEALRLSLNLPAVALLDRLGPLRFATMLKAAGVPARLPAGAEPSLPLALGGAGTTLRELVAGYAMLAGGGEAAPLRLRPDLPAADPVRILEARAAAQLAGALVQPFPGGGPTGVAWKTGTSWGGRDAWAIGFDGRHVLGVWVGRPDGTPIPGLTGRGAALPLLARAFSLLPASPLDASPLRVTGGAGARGEAPDRLRLLFPPPGAVLTGEAGPVTLRAVGGRRPLTFLVDGAPLPHERAKREASWTPPGAGFYRITVLDAEGAAVRAELRVR